jgi:hypothetical protein
VTGPIRTTAYDGAVERQATGEQLALGRVAGQRERPFAGGAGLVVAAEAGQQAGPQRVVEPVAVQFGGQRRDLGQCGLGADHVPGGDGPVQQHHRRRRQRLQPVIQQADLVPVGVLIIGRLRVQRGDGRLDLVGTGPTQRQRAVEQPGGLGDQRPVPAGAVLVREPDQPPPPVEPGRGPGFVQQEQGEQAEDFGLAGHQPVQQPGQRYGLRRQVPSGGLPARAGQVALVEDQVHDGQHLGQPVPELVGVGDAHVGVCGAQRLARPQQPLVHRGLAGSEGGRDLGRGQPAGGTERERDLRLARQRRMAAGEDHAEQLVVGLTFLAGLGAGAGDERGGGRREQGQLLLAGLGPAQPVDRLAAGRGGQPAAGVGRDMPVPPVLDGLDERVLHGVGGEPHVADPCGERGGDPRRLGPVDPLELSRVQDSRGPPRSGAAEPGRPFPGERRESLGEVARGGHLLLDLGLELELGVHVLVQPLVELALGPGVGLGGAGGEPVEQL